MRITDEENKNLRIGVGVRKECVVALSFDAYMDSVLKKIKPRTRRVIQSEM